MLVPPTQIDVFIDSISAVRSTATALETLQKVKDKDILDRANDSKDEAVATEEVESADAE